MSAARLGGRAQLGLMLLPYAAGSLALVAIPALATFGLALFEWDLIGRPVFVGLGNLGELAGDEAVHRTLRATLLLLAIAVPLRAAAATGAALLLHRRFAAARSHRAAVLLPTMLPEVAYALLFLYLLNPLFGPVNLLLGGLGLPQPDWLTTSAGATAAVVLMSAFVIGEGFVVALAVRRMIPAELHDLARLEGSSAWHAARRVTLPLMAPALGLIAARDAILVLQVAFVPALLVTGGGPDQATTFLPLLVYEQAFEHLRYGYAAALTMLTLGLTAAVVAVQWWIVRRIFPRT